MEENLVEEKCRNEMMEDIIYIYDSLRDKTYHIVGETKKIFPILEPGT